MKNKMRFGKCFRVGEIANLNDAKMNEVADTGEITEVKVVEVEDVVEVEEMAEAREVTELTIVSAQTGKLVNSLLSI